MGGVVDMSALTPRERQVVQLLSQGNSPAQIADALCVSRVTVYCHIDSARQKTRTTSTLELAVKAATQDTNKG